MVFPILLKNFRGLPINSHPGAFGCPRKYNFHEGVDLYVPTDKKAEVYAIKDGVVIWNCAFTGPKAGSPWWNNTEALLIKSEDCYYVYGEIHSSLKPGAKVKTADQIGIVAPVLREGKERKDIAGHSLAMLHLEKYNLEFDPMFDFWSDWKNLEDRPNYLEDPTPDLIQILKRMERLEFLHH